VDGQRPGAPRELLLGRRALRRPRNPGRRARQAALLAYFRKLLAYNPDWVWTHLEGIPLEDGFLNKWRATIPVGSRVLEVVGVCLVQLDGAGKIRRNEVYFDRSQLVREIERHRAAVGNRGDDRLDLGQSGESQPVQSRRP
jgi:hypothetical protein